jgi:hypothetical protein
MAGVMIPVVYHSDNGSDYIIRMDASNSVAAGNVGATGSPNLPGRTKPRYVLAAHPTTGRERKIVVGDPANPMWLGTDDTISLPDFNADMAATVFVVRGRIGERRLG